MKISSIKPIKPELSQCIEVDSPERLYQVENINPGEGITTHNSVSQRNIVFSTIMRPENWYFLGVDLKRVELSSYRPYSNVVLKIATELEDAVDVLRFAQQTMMKRYDMMEKLGVQNFLDLPDKGRALAIMVDEAGELLGLTKGKALAGSTDVALADGSFKKLEDVEKGDVILDPNFDQTVVLDKYEPVEQSHHTVKVTKDSDGATQEIHSGGLHLWTVYFFHPDGKRVGPEVLTTGDLKTFLDSQKELPQEERITVKMLRAKEK